MESLLKNLNRQQQNAVLHGKGPMLVLAGAGSGKTRVLTYRIAYLIAKRKVKAANILAVTFTNKAANEMQKRIKALLRENSLLPWIGTFHSLCAWILRLDGYRLGISRGFVIYDDYDQRQVIKKVLENLHISTKKFKPGSVLAAISQAKNELIDPQQYLSLARGYRQEIIAAVYPQYQTELEEAMALDFDDLLLKTVQLFRNNREALTKYQTKFQYILVDEYHDTNTAQYMLTKLLAQQYKNICVVGDCSQSIYGWRGADYRNVLNFKKAFPEVTVYALERNYRSTQTILASAYAVIQHNNTHPVLKLWTKGVKGEKITLYEAENEKDEADFIIRTLLKLYRQHPNLQAADIAVFYRTNAQSRVIEEAFLHYGIPYMLVGGTRFYERKEIKDVLAYLRLVINVNDRIALERISKLGKKRLQALLDFLTGAEGLKEELTTLEIMDELLRITGYRERYDDRKEEDRIRLENIKELESVAAEYPKLAAFLENVALVEREISSTTKTNRLIREENNDAVTLMTLHQAKGLEFDTVFIVGMEEGLFPHARSIDNIYELEEERRLCYVGITRAKKRLYFVHAKRRLYFGRYTSNAISSFIGEIPENLLQFHHTEINAL